MLPVRHPNHSSPTARTLWAISLALALTACDGEDEDTITFVPPPAGDQGLGNLPDGVSPDTLVVGAANGPLTGRVVTRSNVPEPNGLQSLDLGSGTWMPLSGRGIAETFQRYPDSRIHIEPDRSGPGQLVVTVHDCRTLEVCVVFLDSTGAQYAETAYSDRTDPAFARSSFDSGSSRIRRSRDGRLLAFTHGARFLNLVELTGSLPNLDWTAVSQVDLGLHTGSPYDWLLDGTIIYPRDRDPLSQQIVLDIRNPYATGAERSIALQNYRGSVRQIQVSPDGNMVMLKFYSGFMEIPLVLDLRTNEVFEPVSRQDRPFLDIGDGSVTWSPDGQWLIFRTETATNLGTLVPGVPIASSGDTVSPVYAVRVDGRSHALPRTVAEPNESARIVVGRDRQDPASPPGPQHAVVGAHWVN